MSAWDKQVGGSHYKSFEIQPAEFNHRNNLGYMAGNVIKYVSRYEVKKNIDDLRKAAHYIELMLEMDSLWANDPYEAQVRADRDRAEERDLKEGDDQRNRKEEGITDDEGPPHESYLKMTDDGEPFTPTSSRMYDF